MADHTQASDRAKVDLTILADHGVTKSDAAVGGLSGGPMKARVRMRGADLGGAKEGTPELYVGDPDGIVVQLQETSYCGGAGVVGKGLLALRDLSHFTIGVYRCFRPTAHDRVLSAVGRAISATSVPDARRNAAYGVTDTFTMAVVRQHLKPPPPTPE